jgi:RNA polymerase sigma-70 factor (ECF subfamily)
MGEEKNTGDDIASRMRNGDEQAYQSVYNELYLPLFHFTSRLIKDRPVAQEIVSTGFLKLWQMRNRFSTFADMKAFIYTLCRHEAYDFLKYSYNKTNKNTVLTDNIEELLQEDAAPENISQEIIRTEVLKTIYEEIQKLPPQRQAVVKMLFIEGLDTKEVARSLGLSVASVRSTKAKAIEQLRNNALLKKLIASLLLLFSQLYSQFTASLF